MTQPLKSYRISLTTLSPLFIGAGEEHLLSPYSDFVQRGDSLVYIDTEKLLAAVQGDDALVEAFVKGMRQFENNRSTFSLENFITDTLGREVDDFAARVVRIDGDIQKNHIRRFIATGGKPFIPGSSLKGAIRTSVFVEWLLNTKDGKKQLDQISVYVEKRDWKSLKRMDPSRQCFGSISHDLFKYLRVSDSQVFEPSALSVSAMKRVSLRSGRKTFRRNSSDIPQWSETLNASVESFCALSLLKPRSTSGVSFIDNQSIGSLFTTIKQVSLESCMRELDELEAFKEFRDFFRFYENLEQEIKSLRADEAILRLGGGKTWFDNSIGLSIDSDAFGDEKLLGQYLSLLRIGNIPFPSTRSAIVKNNVPAQPPGWIKLSVEDL
ncbi:MAG: type III-A CRISPR-associated RAMP protein Csm5 [Chlorobium limicola]|nr:type III-A CRISPR-associated RAMP protein Csm5 [Chlorobium limicola]